MPALKDMRAGHTYVTAAIPDDAYRVLKANADRLHMPMTEALGLLVVATGAHLPAIVEAQKAAAVAIADQIVAHRVRRKRIARAGKEGAGEGS